MSYARAGLLVSIRDFFSGSASAESLMMRFVQRDDKQALSSLYDQHNNKLYYYLLVMSDTDVAADVTQKTWLKVIEKKHLYSDQGKFEAWLFTMARNTLMDEIRRQNRFEHSADAVDTLVSPEQSSRDNGDFHLALSTLPFEQKEAFSLQQEGFTLGEISQICHVPVETVKTRLRYAREKLRKTLENHCE